DIAEVFGNDGVEDLDDVQEVYHNGAISDEVAATL
ncbi:MAG: YebC/PmpR family DNA-binding transcriptional regulator, partial [Aeromonadaceae bacterium]